MPSHPFFIILLGVAVFVVVSIVLIPLFNKGNRSKISRVVDDGYDVDDDSDVSPQERENILNRQKNQEKKGK